MSKTCLCPTLFNSTYWNLRQCGASCLASTDELKASELQICEECSFVWKEWLIKVWEKYCTSLSDHIRVYSEFDFVLIAKPKCFYSHVHLTFIRWVLLRLLGNWGGFLAACSFASAFHDKDGRNVNAVKKKQTREHLKQLTMENCVLNICNNILTFYPINFYIFYCLFFHPFSLICQHCNCVLLPL